MEDIVQREEDPYPPRDDFAELLAEEQNYEQLSRVIRCHFLFMLFYGGLELIAIVSCNVAAGMANETVGLTLRLFSSFFFARFIMKIPFVLYRLRTRERRESDACIRKYLEYQNIYDWVCCAFLVYHISVTTTIFTDSPIFSYMVCCQVGVFLFFAFLPLFLALCFPILLCCCLPLLVCLGRCLPGPGAGRYQLDDLPSYIFGDGTETGECDCPICLTTYAQGEDMRKLPCGHDFHKECIDTWLYKKARCPLCRQWVIEPPRFMASDLGLPQELFGDPVIERPQEPGVVQEPIAVPVENGGALAPVQIRAAGEVIEVADLENVN